MNPLNRPAVLLNVRLRAWKSRWESDSGQVIVLVTAAMKLRHLPSQHRRQTVIETAQQEEMIDD